MIELKWENWFDIFSWIVIFLFGASAIYGILTNQGVGTLIGVLFMFVVYLLMENRKLTKQIDEINEKLNKRRVNKYNE